MVILLSFTYCIKMKTKNNDEPNNSPNNEAANYFNGYLISI